MFTTLLTVISAALFVIVFERICFSVHRAFCTKFGVAAYSSRLSAGRLEVEEVLRKNWDKETIRFILLLF